MHLLCTRSACVAPELFSCSVFSMPTNRRIVRDYMFFRPKPGEDLLESATSAMRASTHKLLESKPEVFNNLEGSDFDQMVRFGANSPFATVRINMVQIIGGMGVANTSGILYFCA